MAMLTDMIDDVVIRDLGGHADYEACVALQRATWGDDFREIVTPAMLLVAQKVGGIALGAFTEDGALVGFVFGLTGFRDRRPLHWSHMLAVRGDWRDRGLGQRLKHAQRERLVAAGVGEMRWTYDPLVARNAHLNLNRLGARVLEYVPDMYGEPASPADRVIGSDRFIVSWDLTAPAPAPGREVVTAPEAPLIGIEHADGAALPAVPTALVAIPPDIQALKQSHPERARRWRVVTRRAFQHYLGAGYEIAGVARHGAEHLVYVLRATTHV